MITEEQIKEAYAFIGKKDKELAKELISECKELMPYIENYIKD